MMFWKGFEEWIDCMLHFLYVCGVADCVSAIFLFLKIVLVPLFCKWRTRVNLGFLLFRHCL